MAVNVYTHGECRPNPGGVATAGYTIYLDNKKICAESYVVVNGPAATNFVAAYAGIISAMLRLYKLDMTFEHIVIHTDLAIVAIIGPRKAGHGITEEQHREDLNVAYRVAGMCAKKGYVVLSGLALGMDTVGHRGAIDAGGYTVAVLAHGHDAPVYPPENQQLVWEILQGRGSIVSQYETDARPTKERFIERDKTQALLSDRVIVVGSFPGNVIYGGSRHCARWAREFNIPVHLLTNINGYKYIDYFEIA